MNKLYALSVLVLALAACGTGGERAEVSTRAPRTTQTTEADPNTTPEPEAPTSTAASTEDEDDGDIVVINNPAPAQPPVIINNPVPAPAPQPAPASPASRSDDPGHIPAGVIEDGTHYGFLVKADGQSITIDRVDIRSDGSYVNENSKLRTLPIGPGAIYEQPSSSEGVLFEIRVVDQRVTSFTFDHPYLDSYRGDAPDAYRIAPGVIEDGTHYGFITTPSAGPSSSTAWT